MQSRVRALHLFLVLRNMHRYLPFGFSIGKRVGCVWSLKAIGDRSFLKPEEASGSQGRDARRRIKVIVLWRKTFFFFCNLSEKSFCSQADAKLNLTSWWNLPPRAAAMISIFFPQHLRLHKLNWVKALSSFPLTSGYQTVAPFDYHRFHRFTSLEIKFRYVTQIKWSLHLSVCFDCERSQEDKNSSALSTTVFLSNTIGYVFVTTGKSSVRKNASAPAL